MTKKTSKKTSKKKNESVVDKKSEIDELLNTINTKYGKNSSVIGTASQINSKIKRQKTGIPSLDLALYGGWPVGRICSIVGWKSSGKSFVLYNTIAECQRTCRGCHKHLSSCECEVREPKMCALICTENYDSEWGEIIGIDNEKLILCFPHTSDEAIHIIEGLMAHKKIDVVLLDSLAQLSSEEEQSGDIRDSQMGSKSTAICNNKFFRRLNINLVSENSLRDKIFIYINQWRQGIGYNATNFRPGGKGQEFADSVSVSMGGGSWESTKKSYVDLSGKIQKNKTAKAQEQFSFRLFLDERNNDFEAYGSTDNIAVLFQEMIDLGFAKADGGKYVISGIEEIFTTQKAVKMFLFENPDYRDSIFDAILEKKKEFMGKVLKRT